MALYRSISEMSPFRYDGNNTALLLLDFHEGNVKHCGEAGVDALDVSSDLIDWAHGRNMIVVRCLIDPKDKADPRLHGTMLKILADGPEETSDLANNWESMDCTERRPLDESSAYGNVGQFLEMNDQQSLIIAGLDTSGVVLATAIDALDFGHVVTIIVDASADPQRDLEEHLNAKLPFQRFHTMTSDEFTRWRGGGGRERPRESPTQTSQAVLTRPWVKLAWCFIPLRLRPPSSHHRIPRSRLYSSRRHTIGHVLAKHS